MDENIKIERKDYLTEYNLNMDKIYDDKKQARINIITPNKTIITDGYRAYTSIIEDLNFNHQRCTFHAMKDLMDKLLKKHNGINRQITKLNNDIKDIKDEIDEISEKYKGQIGRTRNDDRKERR